MGARGFVLKDLDVKPHKKLIKVYHLKIRKLLKLKLLMQMSYAD